MKKDIIKPQCPDPRKVNTRVNNSSAPIEPAVTVGQPSKGRGRHLSLPGPVPLAEEWPVSSPDCG